MNKPIFTYNVLNASCTFCDRIQNPHPDYSDEPIVITRLKLHQGDQEVCINCYWDIVQSPMPLVQASWILLLRNLM